MKLEKELLEHQSREIETHTNDVTLLRSRASLSVILGPFVVLGSLVIGMRGSPVRLTFDATALVLGVLACASFLALGYLSARIEVHTWDQCNRWREMISRLCTDRGDGEGSDPTAVVLVFPHRLIRVYVWSYAIMLVSFLSTTALVAHVLLNAWTAGFSGAP